MSIKTFTGAGTTGATVTTTSSAGTPLDVAGSTATYGTLGGRSCIIGAGTAAQYGWSTSASAVLLRFKFFATSAISVDTFLAWVIQNTSSAAARALINSASHLRLTTTGSGSSVTRWTDTSTITGAWFRVELLVTAGTSPTTGTARLALYSDDSTAPLADSGLISGIDTAGSLGAFTGARFYAISALGTRDWGMTDGVDAVWGAWPANKAPTVVMPSAQVVTTGGTWSLTPTISDDGTIASSTWTVTKATPTSVSTLSSGLTGASSATLSGDATTTAIPGSVLTATITVTDDGGLSTTASTEIRVPVVPSAGVATLRPLAVPAVTTGTWTLVGSATTDGAALADESAATYVQSSAVSATAQTHRHRLQPCPTGVTAITVTDSVLTDTGTCTAVERIFEGTTVRATGAATTVTTAATDVTVTMADVSTITDPSILWAETVVTS